MYFFITGLSERERQMMQTKENNVEGRTEAITTNIPNGLPIDGNNYISNIIAAVRKSKEDDPGVT